MTGWIKLHRKTLDNPVVYKDADHIAVWTYLLLNATHKEHPAMFAGQKTILQPGQLITGRKSISEKLRVQESKVERILKLFESEHQIEQQKSNKNRIVTLISWHEYQNNEQQDEHEMNNNRTTDEQQVNTNKNVKNVKNEKKNEILAEIETFRDRYSPELIKVIEDYLAFIASQRISKKIADTVVLKIFREFHRFEPVRVEYGIRTHMSNEKYAKAREEYTVGIIRKTDREEAERRIAQLRNGRPTVSGKRQSFDRDEFLNSLEGDEVDE